MDNEVLEHIEQKKMSKMFSDVIKKFIYKKYYEKVDVFCNLKTFEFSMDMEALSTINLDLIIEDDFVKKLMSNKKIPAFVKPLFGLVSDWKVIKRKIANKISKAVKRKTNINTIVHFDQLEISKRKEYTYISFILSISSNFNEIRDYFDKLLSGFGKCIEYNKKHLFVSIEEDKVMFDADFAMNIYLN